MNAGSKTEEPTRDLDKFPCNETRWVSRDDIQHCRELDAADGGSSYVEYTAFTMFRI